MAGDNEYIDIDGSTWSKSTTETVEQGVKFV